MAFQSEPCLLFSALTKPKLKTETTTKTKKRKQQQEISTCGIMRWMISCGETPPIQLVHPTRRGEVSKGERALTVYDEKWQLRRGGGDRSGRHIQMLHSDVRDTAPLIFRQPQPPESRRRLLLQKVCPGWPRYK